MRIAIKWALLLTLAMIGWLFFEWLAGIHSFLIAYFPMSTWVYYLIVAIGIALMMREVNKKVYDFKSTFIDLVKHSVVMMLVLLPLQYLVLWLYVSIINPSLLANLKYYNLEYNAEMVPDDMNPEAFFEQYFAVGNYLLMFSMGLAFLGFVLTFLAAAFIRGNTKRYAD